MEIILTILFWVFIGIPFIIYVGVMIAGALFAIVSAPFLAVADFVAWVKANKE